MITRTRINPSRFPWLNRRTMIPNDKVTCRSLRAFLQGRSFLAVWNDLHRNNAQKRESANRSKPNPPPSGQTGQHPSSQQSKGSFPHQYRPSGGQRVNHIDDTVDMNRNKENSYQRSPPKRQENTYARRRDPDANSLQDRQEQEYQMPMTMTVHPDDNNQQDYPSPKTVAIPLSKDFLLLSLISR